jgi:glycosyltransferase involved in cell wall biosynthesis
MLKYCIVVPAFNEETRILTDDFIEFLNSNNDFHFLFVNDGSTDKTLDVLKDLVDKSEQMNLLDLPLNCGKAEAIRKGMEISLAKNEFDFLGYLDADLAIPLNELLRLKKLAESNYEFIFSSKRSTPDNELEVKFKRFFIGRTLSTMVGLSLRLDVYDTQCGCKMMSNKIAQVVFKEPFISSWLFDIEIFWRIINSFGRTFIISSFKEVPVNKLIDRGGSRIKMSDLVSLPFEFLKIHFHYTNK